MNQLLSDIQSYIRSNELFDLDDRLLLTVSGGIDSIFMVHALQKLCYNITVAHCNFGLRGQASDNDQRFVEELCYDLNIPFFYKKFDTVAYTQANQVSIQMAARELRYHWFFELLDQQGLDYILTAHHANDQVETVLFNLTKGTGISGMRGISNQSKVKRPLLAVTKEQIKNYVLAHELSWREDVSNSSNKYHRNSLRNEVIPLLKKINPSIEKTFRTNTDRFSALERVLKKRVLDIRTAHLSSQYKNDTLDMGWFDSEQGDLIVLDEILKDYGFNFDQTKSISSCIGIESGKRFTCQSHEVVVDRTALHISVLSPSSQADIIVNADTTEIKTNYSYITFERTVTPIEFSKDPNIALLDADLIDFPIKVRKWQTGDYFTPLGMKGKKKLSDFMIDHKIPVNLKKRLLIFESQKKIVWIEGMRIDNKFKITKNTKNVLTIRSIPHV